MKSAINLYILLLLPILSFKINIDPHGFGQGTYIRIYDQKIDAYRSIEQIYENEIENLRVKSYYPESLKQSYQTIKVAGKSKSNCFIRISFNINNSYKNFIECSPIQEFFVIESQKWTPAYLLSTGDTLFAENETGKIITKIEFIKAPSNVYTLEINNTHTFCVGNDAILTHNIPLPIGALLTIGVSFGQGAAAGGTAGSFFGPVTIGAGIVVGGIIGIAAACFTRDKTKAEYRFEFDANKIEAHLKDNLSKSSNNNHNKLSHGSNNINPEDPDDKKKNKDRELIINKLETFEQARNKALEIIGEVDYNSGEPVTGKFGVCRGQNVGRRWHSGEVTIRLDYDPTKGPHINVADFRAGKGVKGTVVAIPFEGNEETVKALLKHLQ